ncbi:hypothetical protein AG1IA_06295 [Rhizoctonia solani AG-1 IA]|uniref:Uncharacterized protein n=1 Tax=Thanatephorus cucumeris (strain AG1-IA) TaxID=983506 RepID=L8WNV8_THACA|nr:hypothetical protein AG1IA_06295 [Rhizoctonia solani AG-1 IA]
MMEGRHDLTPLYHQTVLLSRRSFRPNHSTPCQWNGKTYTHHGYILVVICIAEVPEVLMYNRPIKLKKISSIDEGLIF